MRVVWLGLALISCLGFASAQEPKADSPALAPSGLSLRFEVKGLPDAATSVALHPTAPWLAVGSYDCVDVWNLETREKVQRVPTKIGFVRSLAFSPDGKLLAAGGYQGILPIEVEGWKPQSRLKGHRGYVNKLVFVAGSATEVVSASDDMTVRLWDLALAKELKTFHKFADPVASVALSPDGKLVATATGDETRVSRPGEIQIWNRESGELVHTLPPHKKPPTDVAFSQDGQFLASGSFDEKVNVYDVASGQAKGFFGGHQRPTNCVAFLDGGRLVASGCGGRFQGGNQIRIWTRDEGEVVAGADFEEGKVTDLAVSADGRRVAVSLDAKQAVVFDVDPGLLEGTTDPAAAKETAGVQAPVLVFPTVGHEDVTGLTGNVAPTRSASLLAQGAADAPKPKEESNEEKSAKPLKPIRIGIIGLDTSHAIAFTTVLNSKEKPRPEFAGCTIVAAYPWGSRDIESSTSRIPEYKTKVEALGVKIVDSIEELLPLVDCVMLETNDGRPHLEQVLPVLKAGKPVFVDKPIAASLTDCLAIFEAAEKSKTPLFSSSSLRFIPEALSARNGAYGPVVGCDAFSPCSLEATHPDLFWYGIHGCEILFTVMGPGCETVTRATTKDTDFVTGVWKDGRIGTFRGSRSGKSGYGGTAFGEKQTVPLGNFKGYEPLVQEIIKFFQSGVPPVSPEETIAIYAFMEAADESKRQGGKPVPVSEVLEKAKKDVAARLQAVQK